MNQQSINNNTRNSATNKNQSSIPRLSVNSNDNQKRQSFKRLKRLLPRPDDECAICIDKLDYPLGILKCDLKE